MKRHLIIYLLITATIGIFFLFLTKKDTAEIKRPETVETVLNEEKSITEDIFLESTSTPTTTEEKNIPETITKQTPKAKPETVAIPIPTQNNVEKETNKPPQFVDGVTSGDITSILDVHNTARKSVGISQLYWSETIAKSAQLWADNLYGRGCTMQHSGSNYGENIFYNWTSVKNTNDITTPQKVVNSWLAEKDDYNYAKNTCATGKVCGHYTQAVWSKSTEIGCGMRTCNNNKGTSEIWVCQYNPPGNYVGQKPY